jgi:putative hydrolase of the HAD superfamily
MLKAVIFDLGDTVVKIHHERKTAQYIEILERFGYKKDREKLPGIIKKTIRENVKRFFGKTELHHRRHFFELLLQKLGEKANEDTLILMEEESDKKFLENSELYPHAAEVLEFVRSKNLLVGAICNGAARTTRKWIEKLDIEKFFDIILISEEIGYEKSTLVPFKMFLEKTKLKPEECLMIGNRVDEDVYAKKLGMKTVLLSYFEFLPAGEPEEPDYRIEKIEDVIPIVEELMKG